MREHATNPEGRHPLHKASKRSPDEDSGIGLSLAFAVLLFVVGSDLSIVAPLILDIREGLDITLAQGGLLVTVFAAAYALGSPVLGWMTDRLGRLPVLIGGVGGFVLLEILCALAPNYPTLLVARGLTGIAAAAVSPTAYAILGDVTPFAQRGRAMSIASSGFSVATVAGVPLGLALASIAGWRVVLGSLGVAALLTGLVTLPGVIRRVQADPARTGQAGPTGSPGVPGLRPAPVAAALAAEPKDVTLLPMQKSGRSQLGVFVVSLLTFSVVGLVYTYLSVGLHARFGWSTGMLAWMLLIYGLFNVAGNLLLGRIGDLTSKRHAVRLGQCSEALSLIAVTVALARGWDAVAVLLLWVFALTQAYIPNLKAMASDVPPAARGRSLAWNNAAMYGGLMVGSYVASRLYPTVGLGGLSLVGAAVVALGLLATWGIGDRPTNPVARGAIRYGRS